MKFSVGLGLCCAASGRGGEGGRTGLGGADALFGLCEVELEVSSQLGKSL